jgi:hypothetical protein
VITGDLAKEFLTNIGRKEKQGDAFGEKNA